MGTKKGETQRPVNPRAYDHLDDAFTNACSPTECTGLIAHAPLTEEEYESYMEIYDFQPPYVIQKSGEEGDGPAFGSDITASDIGHDETVNNL